MCFLTGLHFLIGNLFCLAFTLLSLWHYDFVSGSLAMDRHQDPECLTAAFFRKMGLHCPLEYSHMVSLLFNMQDKSLPNLTFLCTIFGDIILKHFVFQILSILKVSVLAFFKTVAYFLMFQRMLFHLHTASSRLDHLDKSRKN